jgi:hypothetical protein
MTFARHALLVFVAGELWIVSAQLRASKSQYSGTLLRCDGAKHRIFKRGRGPPRDLTGDFCPKKSRRVVFTLFETDNPMLGKNLRRARQNSRRPIIAKRL